jgi:RNA-directed DNA polymerase
MGREFHVRFREGLGVQFPRATRLLITGTSATLLRQEVQPLVEHFLKERGLRLSHEKTKLTHVQDGFDFLGQNVRRYRSDKVLLKPSRRNVQTFLNQVRQTIRKAGRSMTAGELIRELKPKIQGWTLYHRHASSKRIYAYVDHQIHQALWRWSRRRHRQQSAHWVKRRYFGRHGGRSWRFTGDLVTRKGEPYTVVLMKAAEIRIKRHVLIRHEANPYDPAWEPYYEARLQAKMAATIAGRDLLAGLYERQGGRCLHCGDWLTDSECWEVHHRHWRVHGGDDSLDNLELLHETCHHQIHSRRMETKQAAFCEGRK